MIKGLLTEPNHYLKENTLVTKQQGACTKEIAKKRESEITNLLSQTNSIIRSRFRSNSAFALGESGIMVIEEAIKKKILPKVPIFCSGLGWT